jgi:surface rod structure-forming protein G
MERAKEILGTIFGYSVMAGIVALIFSPLFTGQPPPDTCVSELIPYTSQRVDDPDRDIGSEFTLTDGVIGEQTICTNSKNEETSNRITTDPVNEVIQVGTREPAPLSGPYVAPPYEEDEEYEGGVMCNDGSHSNSTGRGTCSWHDGVDYYL